MSGCCEIHRESSGGKLCQQWGHVTWARKRTRICDFGTVTMFAQRNKVYSITIVFEASGRLFAFAFAPNCSICSTSAEAKSLHSASLEIAATHSQPLRASKNPAVKSPFSANFLAAAKDARALRLASRGSP